MLYSNATTGRRQGARRHRRAHQRAAAYRTAVLLPRSPSATLTTTWLLRSGYRITRGWFLIIILASIEVSRSDSLTELSRDWTPPERPGGTRMVVVVELGWAEESEYQNYGMV